MEKQERRTIGRVKYQTKALLVVCENQEVIHGTVRDLSPLGVGMKVPPETPSLLGKDVILIGETLIMYADVVRQVPLEHGGWAIGLTARRFSAEVLQFLFEGIELRTKLAQSLPSEEPAQTP